MSKNEPKRMCIACREMKDKRELFRVVKNAAGEIFVDTTLKAAGRGAYICGRAECIQKLKKQRLLHKAFSAPVGEDIYLKIEEEVLGQNAKS